MARISVMSSNEVRTSLKDKERTDSTFDALVRNVARKENDVKFARYLVAFSLILGAIMCVSTYFITKMTAEGAQQLSHDPTLGPGLYDQNGVAMTVTQSTVDVDLKYAIVYPEDLLDLATHVKFKLDNVTVRSSVTGYTMADDQVIFDTANGGFLAVANGAMIVGEVNSENFTDITNASGVVTLATTQKVVDSKLIQMDLPLCGRSCVMQCPVEDTCSCMMDCQRENNCDGDEDFQLYIDGICVSGDDEGNRRNLWWFTESQAEDLFKDAAFGHCPYFEHGRAMYSPNLLLFDSDFDTPISQACHDIKECLSDKCQGNTEVINGLIVDPDSCGHKIDACWTPFKQTLEELVWNPTHKEQECRFTWERVNSRCWWCGWVPRKRCTVVDVIPFGVTKELMRQRAQYELNMAYTRWFRRGD